MLSYIRKHQLMRPGDRVGAAVSGGADSVALLRLLLDARAELGIVLSVVHFNHKIRGAEADADEKFVRDLARAFQLEFHTDSADTPAVAQFRNMSLEAAARDLRYACFNKLMAERRLDRVATAHTRDDQAETVLMRFLRGSGTRGLAGIYPAIGGWIAASAEGGKADLAPTPRIVRPLLGVTRDELRAYLQEIGQPWREDASNADVSFARNRLRHQVLPLLRQLNPGLDQVLSDTADIAREEESWWNQQTTAAQQGLWSPRPQDWPAGAQTPVKMRVSLLLAQPLALQRRLIRMVLETPDLHLGFDHVEAVLALAAGEPTRSEKVIELPHGWEAARQGEELWLRRRCPSRQEETAYDIALPVPREVEVAGRKIRAALVSGEELMQARARVPQAREGVRATRVLLEPALTQHDLRVRNWRAGDRYWPAHTSGPKKLKELLQARHIPGAQKSVWPVIVRGDDIIWVPGFAAPERFRVQNSELQALLLEELPLGRQVENTT